MIPSVKPQLSQDYTILVLEDERPLLDAIKIKMENSGLDVVTARTVNQGLNYLDELSKVDAIWLDHYLLGKETGLNFVAKLKESNSKWRYIPVFVVSNSASDDKVNAYIGFGVNRFYTKTNYRLDQIVSEIVEFLKNSEHSNES